MTLWHRLKHALGLQRGVVVSAIWNRAVWIGYRCGGCGKVTGKHVAGRVPPDREFRP